MLSRIKMMGGKLGKREDILSESGPSSDERKRNGKKKHRRRKQRHFRIDGYFKRNRQEQTKEARGIETRVSGIPTTSGTGTAGEEWE